MEAPDRVHFWVGVATVAGALRRRVWIEQPKFDWAPNFYIMLVGPPGIIAKTTSMNAGMGLLEQIKPKIHFGPESMTWQALGHDLMEAKEVIVLGTGEDAEKIPISALTIAAGEAGTLLKLDDDGLASMLITVWEGQRSYRPFRHATVSASQLDVVNPCLNVICCTTPDWLKRNFPDHMIGGGLSSRITFVYADRKRRLVAYPSRVWKDNVQRQTELRKGLIADLEEIAKLKGRFTLTDAAMDWGEAWHERVWNGPRPPHLASARYDAYISRKQTTLHKIAMILSVVRNDDLTITPDLLEEADILLTANEQDMVKVYNSIGSVDEARRAGEITQLLRNYGELSTSALWKHCQPIMEQKLFREALVAAIEAGLIERFPHSFDDGSRFGLRVKDQMQ